MAETSQVIHTQQKAIQMAVGRVGAFCCVGPIDCGQKASALSSSGRGSDGQGRTSHERFARAGSEVRHPASERVASA